MSYRDSALACDTTSDTLANELLRVRAFVFFLLVESCGAVPFVRWLLRVGPEARRVVSDAHQTKMDAHRLLDVLMAGSHGAHDRNVAARAAERTAVRRVNEASLVLLASAHVPLSHLFGCERCAELRHEAIRDRHRFLRLLRVHSRPCTPGGLSSSAEVHRHE